MAEEPVVVDHERLTEFIVSVLEGVKMSTRTARLTADLMVRTDLRGVDSHWDRHAAEIRGMDAPGIHPPVGRADRRPGRSPRQGSWTARRG